MGIGSFAFRGVATVQWTDTVTAIATGVIALFASAAIWQVRAAVRGRTGATLLEVDRNLLNLRVEQEMVAGIASGELLRLAQAVIGGGASEADRDRWVSAAYLANWYETVGLLAHLKVVSARNINQMYGGLIIGHYEQWHQTIAWLQERDSHIFVEYKRPWYGPALEPERRSTALSWTVALADEIYKLRGIDRPDGDEL